MCCLSLQCQELDMLLNLACPDYSAEKLPNYGTTTMKLSLTLRHRRMTNFWYFRFQLSSLEGLFLLDLIIFILAYEILYQPGNLPLEFWVWFFFRFWEVFLTILLFSRDRNTKDAFCELWLDGYFVFTDKNNLRIIVAYFTSLRFMIYISFIRDF